jgi:hypothetical protein
MIIRLNISESNKDIFVQQNYIGVKNNIIKIRNAFSESGVYEFNFTGNIVEFTVPTSGTYKIEAWGARGGGSNVLIGPEGAYSKSFVLLNKDEIIKILVGEKGYPGLNSCNYCCGGGGGGTFIAKNITPLCVAGGGGSYALSYYSTVQSHACGQSTQLSADFGNGQVTLKMGGYSSSLAGGGGGFEGNGANGTYPGYEWGIGGNSFISGGARQTYGDNHAYGGFGGGASNHGNNGSPAGGGGYTGGTASKSSSTQGGGGGSYFEGTYNHEVSEAISGCNVSLPTNPSTNGNGFAKLTFLTVVPSAIIIKCPTCLYYKNHISWVHFVIFLSQ